MKIGSIAENFGMEHMQRIPGAGAITGVTVTTCLPAARVLLVHANKDHLVDLPRLADFHLRYA